MAYRKISRSIESGGEMGAPNEGYANHAADWRGIVASASLGAPRSFVSAHLRMIGRAVGEGAFHYAEGTMEGDTLADLSGSS